QINYTFTLSAPASLYFFFQINDEHQVLHSFPTRRSSDLSGRSFGGSDSVDINDPQLRLPAGSYTLTVDASGDAVGAYSFRLLDLSGAPTITPRTPFSGGWNPANETDAYKFTVGTANRPFF